MGSASEISAFLCFVLLWVMAGFSHYLMYNMEAGGNRGSAIHSSFSISGRTDTLLGTYVLWSLG